jgi:hypothetical protein
MSANGYELDHMYVLHGHGGMTTIQSRLAEYGLCSSDSWDPCPPDWRFRFRTSLPLDSLAKLLADVQAHYCVRLYVDAGVYGRNPSIS